jgi:hypothetical protein
MSTIVVVKNSSVARSFIDQVHHRFQETNGRGQCIDRVLGVGADINPDLDLYRSNEQDIVNEINSQRHDFAIIGR